MQTDDKNCRGCSLCLSTHSVECKLWVVPAMNSIIKGWIRGDTKIGEKANQNIPKYECALLNISPSFCPPTTTAEFMDNFICDIFWSNMIRDLLDKRGGVARHDSLVEWYWNTEPPSQRVPFESSAVSPLLVKWCPFSVWNSKKFHAAASKQMVNETGNLILM